MICIPFQIVKFQTRIGPFGEEDILDKHDLPDLVEVEDGLQADGQLDLYLVAAREGGRSHGLAVGGKDDGSSAILFIRLILTVNPSITPICRSYVLVLPITNETIIKIAPAFHWNAVCINTSELMLPTASEGEQDLVGGVGGAGARVVVHRPLGGAQQS